MTVTSGRHAQKEVTKDKERQQRIEAKEREREISLYSKYREATQTGVVEPKRPQLQSCTHSNIEVLKKEKST